MDLKSPATNAPHESPNAALASRDSSQISSQISSRISSQISAELGVSLANTETVIRLLDDGNTIPFLARYRKEQTGGLDEEVLRSIEQRLGYLRVLAERKLEVVRLIEELDVLTPEIRQAIDTADTLQRIDDIYRPFRPKRKTRASMARERGLEPLAMWLLSRPSHDPAERAAEFVNPEHGVESAEDALSGARDIVAEILADDPGVRQWVRQFTFRNGILATEAITQARTYEQYYDFREPVNRIRPHRVLAINRGEREKAIRVRIEVPADPVLEYLRRWFMHRAEPADPSPADPQLALAAQDAYSRLLAPAVERDVRNRLTEQADAQAIRVFSANLRALLLTPPIKGTVMGVDPAYRTGCKIAIVDATGRLLDTTIVYPTPPQNRIEESERVLLQLIARYSVDVIAIGNGTASREAEAFVAGMIKKASRPLAYVIVSEAGASVYSASKIARDEFPDLDISKRSAASIARRLQDPLAELVKIDPKSIGVGQYQHDVAEKELAQSLHDVVESAVNSVGVDVNTASSALLSYVAGVSPSVANNIVKTRETYGPFPDRAALREVPRLGPKTFEQCAGFLRVPGGNPLDHTPIHPESYPVARQLLEELGYSVEDVIGPPRDQLCETLASLDTAQWADRLGVGRPTLDDIIEALERPGRDPRDELPLPILRTDVLTLDHLRPGMVLQGTVRNVVDFGAFVDIGVEQDGLVHISELSEQYIRHPLDAVSVGDIVQVTVMSVDKERKRIGLSMKGGASFGRDQLDHPQSRSHAMQL